MPFKPVTDNGTLGRRARILAQLITFILKTMKMEEGLRRWSLSEDQLAVFQALEVTLKEDEDSIHRRAMLVKSCYMLIASSVASNTSEEHPINAFLVLISSGDGNCCIVPFHELAVHQADSRPTVVQAQTL